MPGTELGSLLERQGRIRHVDAVGWAVWVDESSPRDQSTSLLLAGGDQILMDSATTVPFETVDQDGLKQVSRYIRTSRQTWEPEILRRLFLRFIAEPIYRTEDLEMLRQDGHFIILKTKGELEAFNKRQKVRREEESRAALAARRSRELESIKEQAEAVAKARGTEP